MTVDAADTTSPKPESAAVLEYEPPKAPALGHRTASGFVWMLAQTFGTKIIGFVSQIVLAWLLTKQDFGLVALTYAIGSFPSLIRDAGLAQILVHRQKRLRAWSGTAFWMSLAMGFVAGGVMIASGLVAFHRGKPALGGLLIVLSLSSPVSALGTVPNAKILADLRFRFQALLAFWTALITAILNIILASKYFNWGPYAMVVPLVISNGIKTVATWVAAHPEMKWKPQLHRWKYLLGDSGTILATNIAINLMTYGDYLTLGWFYKEDVVGVFFFAFNLSMQTFVLFSLNLGGVLFPALSKLKDDPVRQAKAFTKAAKVLALIAIPFCFLQAACAYDAIHAVFSAKWEPAIASFAILSAGTAIRVVGSPAGNLINAQGRWLTNFILAICYAVGFVIAVVTGALVGKPLGGFSGATAVAVAETIYFCLIDPLNLYIAIRPAGGTVKDLAEVYLPPLVSGAIAAVAGWAMGQLVPHMRFEHWIRLVVITTCTLGIYVSIVRLAAPQAVNELMERARAFRSRRVAAT